MALWVLHILMYVCSGSNDDSSEKARFVTRQRPLCRHSNNAANDDMLWDHQHTSEGTLIRPCGARSKILVTTNSNASIIIIGACIAPVVELIELSIGSTLRRLGYSVHYDDGISSDNRIKEYSFAVVFNSEPKIIERVSSIAANTSIGAIVIVQTEQWSSEKYTKFWSSGINTPIFRQVREVWEYSCDNLRHYPLFWKQRAVYVPFLSDYTWNKYLGGAQSIQKQRGSIVFDGDANERRIQWLNDISSYDCNHLHSLTVTRVARQFGNKIRSIRQRAEIILNIHFYMPPVLEYARIIPAFAFGSCVVSEDIPDTLDKIVLQNTKGIIFVNSSRAMASAVCQLLSNTSALCECQQAAKHFAAHHSLFTYISRINDAQRTKKIIITGTGRAGTTFLMQLLQRVGLRTGFEHNHKIDGQSHAGLELGVNSLTVPNIDVVKNPAFAHNMSAILREYSAFINVIIIPVRNIHEVAASRAVHGINHDGGFTKGVTSVRQQRRQAQEAHTALNAALQASALPYIYLVYPKHVLHEYYAYERLKPILDAFGIERLDFLMAHREIRNPTLVHNYTSNPLLPL